MAQLLSLLSTPARRGLVQSAIPALSACLQQSLGGSAATAAAGAAAAAAAAAPGGPVQLLLAAQLLPTPRGFHAARPLLAAVESDRALSAVLAAEIKHEQTAYEQDPLVAQGPPAPFKLTSTPGDTAISLTRSFGAGEQVSVDCSINMQDSLALPFGENDDDDDDEMAGGGEEDEDDASDVTFNVTLTRGASALVFECISDGSYLDVRHVSLEPAGGLPSDTAFSGPVFGELDEGLQDALRGLLAERGVDEGLGEYLRHLVYDVEQREYVRWLGGVKDFVDSGAA